MAFSKLKTGSPVKTDAPQPNKVVEQAKAVEKVAEVVKEAVAEKVQPVESRAVSLFGAMGNMGLALYDVIDQSEYKPSPFPVLQLTGGKTGGMFAPAPFVAEEIGNQLPQGKKPIDAVFMAYRLEVVSWPVGFKDRTDESGKPAFAGAVSCVDVAGNQLVADAAKAVQFTKAENKGKWDYATSGVGHIQPALSLLVYLPEVDDIIEIRTPLHYTSYVLTKENLKRQGDPQTKQIGQFPCTLRPVSTSKKVGQWDVMEHSIDFAKDISDKGRAAWEKYTAFIAKASQDEETKAKIEEWFNATDRPLSSEARNALMKAKTL